MRSAVLTVGGLIGSGLALLGILILLTGKAEIPIRGADYSAVGLTAYAIGIAWLSLGAAIFCASIVKAGIGHDHRISTTRDVLFLMCGIGFVAASLLAVLKNFLNIEI